MTGIAFFFHFPRSERRYCVTLHLAMLRGRRSISPRTDRRVRAHEIALIIESNYKFRNGQPTLVHLGLSAVPPSQSETQHLPNEITGTPSSIENGTGKKKIKSNAPVQKTGSRIKRRTRYVHGYMQPTATSSDIEVSQIYFAAFETYRRRFSSFI